MVCLPDRFRPLYYRWQLIAAFELCRGCCELFLVTALMLLGTSTLIASFSFFSALHSDNWCSSVATLRDALLPLNSITIFCTQCTAPCIMSSITTLLNRRIQLWLCFGMCCVRKLPIMTWPRALANSPLFLLTRYVMQAAPLSDSILELSSTTPQIRSSMHPRSISPTWRRRHFRLGLHVWSTRTWQNNQIRSYPVTTECSAIPRHVKSVFDLFLITTCHSPIPPFLLFTYDRLDGISCDCLVSAFTNSNILQSHHSTCSRCIGFLLQGTFSTNQSRTVETKRSRNDGPGVELLWTTVL